MLLHIISQEGNYKKIILSRDADKGEQLQYAVPFGNWFAAEVKNPKIYSLLDCTVAPGFDFNDFRKGSKKKLSQQFSKHAEIINRLSR